MGNLSKIALDIAAGFTGGINDFCNSLFSIERKTEYDSTWARPTEYASQFNYGFCINGKHSLTIKESFSNMLVIGGTGSGKSAGILIPGIFKMAGHSSLIIHDPSTELIRACGPHLKKCNCIIDSLNYADPSTSIFYNPLLRTKTVSDLKKLAKIIVRTALGSKDVFWNTSAERLLTFIFQVLKEQDKVYCNLYNAYYLVNCLSYSEKGLFKLVARINNEFLNSEMKSLLGTEARVFQNIISTCQAALAIYNDPSVAIVTSKDTLNIEDYRTNKRVLFINNSIKDIAYYAPISSIFFEQVWGEIMSTLPTKGQLPVFFLLDEASSLKLAGSSLSTTLSNIRKHGSGICHVYQHFGQMLHMYGAPETSNLSANSNVKLYMPGQSSEVAARLESDFGKFEFLDKTGNRRVMPLASADQIRMMDEVFIVIGNKRVIRSKLYMYFDQFRFKHFTSMEKYEPTKNVIADLPPLIQFPE